MSFGAPFYLAALAALVLPWALHRFSDTRPEERPFPSTRFLEPTVPPVSRRRRLRHRILLALRALALAALAFLFAEPWIARPEALADVRALHVLAVDTSLSMRAGERFERALERARERLGEIPEGDAVLLLGFDHEIRLADEAPGPASTARAALERLSPGFAAADYGRLMQRVDRIADESGLPTRLVLVTDAQRSSLPERRNALFAPHLERLEIVDVAGAEANVALGAELDGDDGATVRVVANLAASGGEADDDDAFDRAVTVEHDGERLARERLRLAPGERRAVVVGPLTLPSAAPAALDVVLEGSDALAADDGLRLPLAGDGGRRVALAALEARAPDAARVFVTTALEAEDAARVDASAIASGQLPDDARELVVFTPLDDTATLPAALARFVSRGGSALLVDAAPREDAIGGLGGTDTDADTGDGEYEADVLRGRAVGRVDVSHPLALGEIDWSGVRFFELGGYVPRAEDRVLVETEDRRPVLIERPSDGGIALVLNERLDGSDSTLPFQPAMVTLMHRVVEWFEAARSVPERALVGETIALPANVQVLDPDERALFALADTASTGSFVAERPGLYTVVGSFGEQTLGVVTDPRESDLATIPETEIIAWEERHGGGEGGDRAVVTAAREASSQEMPAPAQLALWPWLLPLLGALLAAETLFANRRLDVRRDGT